MTDTKVAATITDVYDTHAFALDAWGVRYFIFMRACETMGRWTFADLQRGSRVRLVPIEHPKGPRGIEVEILEI